MVPSREQAGLAVKFVVPTVASAKVSVRAKTELNVYGFFLVNLVAQAEACATGL